jgi:hypothetical protein
MQRVRWAIGQIAVPSSGRLPEPMPMLLDVPDLSPGWKVLDQRRWRTGQTPADWSRRAKQLGGVTAWRSFESPAEARWLWVQAVPLASETDVEAALDEIWTRTLKNLRAKVRLVGEREGPQLNGVGSANRALEQTTEGPFGPGVVRLAAWGHRGVLSVMCASAKRDTAPWSNLETLASKQNRKIDLVLQAASG